MSWLPVWSVGSEVVIEERWRGLLWSAVPHRVVSSTPERLLGWVPAGTRSMYATNRGLPETTGMTRDERKLHALKTCRAVASEFAEAPHKLSVCRPDRWSKVNLGWDPDSGRFLGWYVDFQLPVQPTGCGLATKDLVLDLWIDSDRNWQWKDRDDLETAFADGLIEPSVRGHLDRDAEMILTELDRRAGPFSDDLLAFDLSWSTPWLPSDYAWGGSAWSLPRGRRAG